MRFTNHRRESVIRCCTYSLLPAGTTYIIIIIYCYSLLLHAGTGWDGDIAIDPFDSNTAIHTTGQGVWISHDINQSDTGAPTHWTFADRNLEETVPLELVAAPPTHPDKAILLSALGDIDGFVHTDLDKPSSFGMFSPSCGTNQGLDVAWLAPTHVVRTVSVIYTCLSKIITEKSYRCSCVVWRVRSRFSRFRCYD